MGHNVKVDLFIPQDNINEHDLSLKSDLISNILFLTDYFHPLSLTPHDSLCHFPLNKSNFPTITSNSLDSQSTGSSNDEVQGSNVVHVEEIKDEDTSHLSPILKIPLCQHNVSKFMVNEESSVLDYQLNETLIPNEKEGL